MNHNNVVMLEPTLATGASQTAFPRTERGNEEFFQSNQRWQAY